MATETKTPPEKKERLVAYMSPALIKRIWMKRAQTGRKFSVLVEEALAKHFPETKEAS